jgi:hypothetical protein
MLASDKSAPAAKTDKAADKAAEKAAAALKKIGKSLVDGGVAGAEGVAGDVLPLTFEQKVELNVRFPAGKKVVIGKELPLGAVLSIPAVTYTPTPDTFYTLVMVDPDAPSRADAEGEYRHWVVANIPGAEINKGEVLQDWAPPSPPSGSGLHRYVFILYEQPERLETTVFESVRSKWACDAWATEMGMTPVGATFFQAQEK